MVDGMRLNFFKLVKIVRSAFKYRDSIYGILDLLHVLQKLLSATQFTRTKSKNGYVYRASPLDVWNLYPLLCKRFFS